MTHRQYSAVQLYTAVQLAAAVQLYTAVQLCAASEAVRSSIRLLMPCNVQPCAVCCVHMERYSVSGGSMLCVQGMERTNKTNE